LFKGAPVEPGSHITIKGEELAEAVGLQLEPPYPTELAGTELLLGEQPLRLTYVGPSGDDPAKDQVNAQVPYELREDIVHQLFVRRGKVLSAPIEFTVARAQPGVFTVNQTGAGQGFVLRVSDAGAAPADSSNPAVAGEHLVILATGLGAETPEVPSGETAPVDPQARAARPVTVSIGGRSAEVLEAGLIPGGAPGVYQIRAVMPTGVEPGDAVPVVVRVGTQESAPVTMAAR
jgi:uncharacterized protein (TIGR03437 family)